MSAYVVALAVAFALAALHAWRKLSPYFALTWFVAGVAFGLLWRWGGRHGDALPASALALLPALVFYVAAAAVKGLVESTPALAGRHVVHVLMTGVASIAVAWPHEVCWAARLGTRADGAAPAWGLGGLAFYGVYKALDHAGLPRAVQTVALALALPALAWLWP